MLRIIRSVVRVDLGDLKLELGIQAGGWLLGEILVFLLMRLAGDMTSVPALGTAFALYGALLCMLITDTVRFWGMYALYLRFPLTRRASLLGHMAAMLTHNAALAAGALFWAGVGAVLHPLLYAGMGLPVTPTLAYTPWPAWLALLLVPLPMGLLACGITTRFGRKGGWVLYVVFMMFCFSLSNIMDYYFDVFAASDNWWMLLAGGAAALAVALALCVRWLLRAAVNG